ncbi:Putative penicillin-binding protein PbpX [Chryseobacterium aquaeductus]|uniref:Penicillin-binding protein PbpX n=1 Tax=Chryseobacterium aquaeductus TaxID=2675056 RepID=A0A9N8MEQ0_9FLAO|nr:serine hydrolase domain-containing protein [Chryseobacterium aquaeductus]CAA7329868.1 Putative penicillin-binding protein PbpX [Chryseobacterium potabilaquae]CAD7799646.1 Putative penicillin-binding protein PbpX [Chryseobacterium aquaeductus]
MKNKFFLVLILLAQTFYAQEITGSWKGELNIEGTKLPIVFHIKQDKDLYTSTTDSPLQNVKDMPVDKTTFQNNELMLEIKSIGAVYKGKLNDKKITGTLTQGGESLPLTLESFEKESVKPVSQKVLHLSTNMNESIKKLEDFISYLENNNAEAGELSIFKDGKEIYKRNFGQKNLPNASATDVTFQIGSITKTMTAVMVFKLIEKKQLNLDDKLSKFFPKVPNADKITITQLLSHTAGLGDYVQGKNEVMWLTHKTTEMQIMDRIVEQGSVFEPGTSSEYSNTGYYLLTKILEKITKKSYSENIKEYIVAPLKMQNFFSADQKPSNVFKSYQYLNSWKPVTDFDFNNVVGVGDIATTPTNLNVIINSIFDEKLVSKKVLNQMMPKEKEKYGRGIIKVPFFSKMFYGHSGGTYGTNSLMVYNPEDRISLSYSLNADRIGINNFVIGVLSMLYNENYEYPKLNNQKVSRSELKKYEGDYSSKDIPLGLKIFVKDDALFAQGTDQPEFPLEFTEKDQFKFDKAGVKIIFLPESKQLKLVQGGVTYLYDKK